MDIVGSRQMDLEPQSNKRLLLFCLFAALVVLASCYSRTFTSWGNGDGLTLQPTRMPFLVEVSAAAGPAARAGIEPGDKIDERTLPANVGGGVRNSARHVAVSRNGHIIQMDLTPAIPQLGWDEQGRFVAEIWTVLFAALIAWRGKRWRGAAPLAFILALGVVGDALSRGVVPNAPLTVVSHLVGLGLFGPASFILLARYFTTFGLPLSTSRSLWTRIAYAASALSVLAVFAHYLASLTIWISAQDRPLEFGIFEFFLTLPVIPTVVCGFLAARDTGRADGQRVGWVVASYGVFWFFWILAGPLSPLWGTSSKIVWSVEDAAHIFVPLGLSYAALSRRLFDVGFIVNRAVVFTVVSTIVVGSFVVLEWAIGKWFENVSHSTSLTLNVALALALGLSMRFLHRRVDSFVDTVFFRKRHENERALRRFAREATFVTDRRVLLERSTSEILDHSEVSSANAVVAGSLDPNDPAVLALRAWHEPVELARYKTAITGEYAFPMNAHGNFLGAIVCGPKKNEEAYAPDEIESLKELAHGVGLALWSLDAAGNRGDVLLEILAELRALRGGVAET
jgi:hypothetical protein